MTGLEITNEENGSPGAAMENEFSPGGKPAPATAYSYLRLSSKRQANTEDSKTYRDGFRRQIALRDEYLARNPHLTLDTRLVLHDIGVSGYTGANVARGGGGKLAAFLAEVEAGRIARGSHLLVESLDRMSRQQVGRAQAVLLSLVNSGIVVVSLTDGQVYRESRDASQFIMSIMSLTRAHEESVVKATRLRQTWERKRQVALERPISGRCPAWLKVVDGTFVADDDRVEVVREILGHLADGIGRDRIARILNARGEKPWGHGTQWHGGTVQKLTDNRALIGEFQPHKLVYEERKGVMVAKRVPVGDPIPGYFPRVVDDELWTRARAVAVKRRLGKAPNAGGRQGTYVTNLFGEVAACRSCGKRMTYRDRGPRSFAVLRCSGERAGTCTNSYRFPYQDNENAILSWLIKVDFSGKAPGEAARLDEEMRRTIAKRDEMQSRGEAIVRDVGVSSRFAKAPLAEIEAELNVLEVRISELGAQALALKASGGAEERRMAVAHLIELHQDKAPVEQIFAARWRIRQIIRETVAEMWCHPEGYIDILTIDGEIHLFRDGYWWCAEEELWVPWAGAAFGGGYWATKKELARRRVWLEEAYRIREAKLGSKEESA
ncbi:recombinase family protein [Methylobacterium radiotolerans]|uniref:recombinase family protein n=1 Tax=Methylobacterium radiotolerans TaxID=31998 RepID=UPI001AECA306|nr:MULTISPECIES: recombinase family protein [Methylobacterium]MBN6820630.1 recombinase family protein [Methylobacterium organophilum]